VDISVSWSSRANAVTLQITVHDPVHKKVEAFSGMTGADSTSTDEIELKLPRASWLVLEVLAIMTEPEYAKTVRDRGFQHLCDVAVAR
jgi:hypothetical protein